MRQHLNTETMTWDYPSPTFVGALCPIKGVTCEMPACVDGCIHAVSNETPRNEQGPGLCEFRAMYRAGTVVVEAYGYDDALLKVRQITELVPDSITRALIE